MEKENILTDFNETFESFVKTIALYGQQNFNAVPFEGSWTPGRVVQHIVLAASGFADVLNGEVKTTERAIDELIPTLKSILLDFGTKMKSPDFILPVLKEYDQDELLSKINKIKADVTAAIEDLDLSKTCLSFELPKLGLMTRLEAIYFVIFHTKRHTHQLEEIYQFLKLS